MRLNITQLPLVVGLCSPALALAVTTALGVGGAGNSLVVQADGKPLVAGYALSGTSLNQIYSVALLRYNSDGSLDSGFGTGGVVTSSGGPGISVAMQADGKILLASASSLKRYNTDGSADTSFGTGGSVAVNAGAVNGVVVQADGKILLTAGSALLRYNTDGTPDLIFGINGVASTSGTAYGIAVQLDGRILVAGNVGLLRFNGDGSSDLSFGVSGRVATTIGVNPVDGSSIVIQSHTVALETGGRILISGYVPAGRGTYDSAFALYNSDGSLATSFGTAGVVTNPGLIPIQAYRLANDVTVQADGKFLAATGIAPFRLGSLPGPGGLMRYNADGTVDTSFGTAGAAANNAFTGQAISVLADGRVLAAGSIDNGSNTAIALLRYGSNGILDSSFGAASAASSVPGIPAIGSPVAGNAQATVNFSPPVDVGGSAITNYLVTSSPGGNAAIGATSPITVTGLSNGTSYTFSVAAANAAGFGAASPTSAAVTPLGNLLAPNLNLATGWNLLGNGLEAPIPVATTFSDPTKVSTVWKWVTAGSTFGVTYPTWAFYAPAQSDGGRAFASGQGYEFLNTINAGEGFWVNAMTSFTTALTPAVALQSHSFRPASTATVGGTHALPHGWSLISTGDSPTPAQLDEAIASQLPTPPAPGQIAALATNLTSLWSWDTAKQKWYFWAPSLVNSNGLTSYINSNGFLDFATIPAAPVGTISPTTGIWVNLP